MLTRLVVLTSSGGAMGFVTSQVTRPASSELEGWAAVIGASAGMLTAVISAALAFRNRQGLSDEARVEVLMELLEEERRQNRQRYEPGGDEP